jgi:hypothetical protein
MHVMARRGASIVCCLVASGSSGLIQADDRPLPSVGSRIRVSSVALESTPLVGTLAAVSPASLTVVPQDGREPHVVALQDIYRLERSVKPSRKSHGALIGFVVGLAAMFGRAVINGGCNDGCDGEDAVEAALVAASTGAVGALVSPGERWADVPTGDGQSRTTMSFGARSQVRVVPHLGRRIGLTVVASF